MRADIVAGAIFPDYELSDHHGKHRTLSDLQGSDPLVLVLSRGGFLLQRCRPDWDISSAEQRTSWAKGEKTSFYPYGKTQAQVFAERD